MRRRGGFVLIAALWLIVVLSAVALDAALRSQPTRLAAANRLDETRSREAALAGTEYARARLSEALIGRAEELRAEMAATRTGRRSGGRGMAALMAADDTWRNPNELMPEGMALGDAEFVLDVRDTGLSVNMNDVDEFELREFLTSGLRIDYAQADRLTQAILDWRDEDDLPRINGGERDQYIEAGMPVLPANRPFAEVAELRFVMGMTAELFAAIEPYVTVIGSGRINVNAAPGPVLHAVPGFTPAAVSAMLRLQTAGPHVRSVGELRELMSGVFEVPSGREATAFSRRVSFTTNEIEIVSVGRVEGGSVHSVVRAVVVRSDAGAVVLWRRIE